MPMAQNASTDRYRKAAELFRNKDHAGALQLLDELIAAHPKAAPLHFHRGRCLEAMGQREEAARAFDTALALAPDHVATMLARVTLAEENHEEFDTGPLLRRAVALEPDNATALFLCARAVLENYDGSKEPDVIEQALARLDRSIEIDPTRAAAWACRGNHHHLRAHGAEDAIDVVHDALGTGYDRAALELALSDLSRAASLAQDNQYDRLCARIAALLDQPERAVQHMDRVLERLPVDASARSFIEEERARYARGKEGERDELARMLESAGASEGVERSVQDDMSYALTHATAELVRQGMDLQTALTALAGDESPEDLQATQIAFSLYAMAHEAEPDMAEVDPAQFPAFQRKHAEACEKALEPLGYTRLAYAEARGISAQQGQRALLGLFTHPEYGSAASFAMKPKWPGLIGFLLMFLTGQWKAARMLECATRFDDDFYMSSRAAGPDPFETDGIRNFSFEKLPPKASPRDVAERHIERVIERLDAGHAVVPVDTIEDIEATWRETSALKLEHRQSIGYATDGELRAILGKHYDKLAGRVRDRLNLLARQNG